MILASIECPGFSCCRRRTVRARARRCCCRSARVRSRRPAAQRAGRRDRRGLRLRQRPLLQGQARVRARVRAAAGSGRGDGGQRRARHHADRGPAPGRNRSPPTRCARSPASTSPPTIRATVGRCSRARARSPRRSGPTATSCCSAASPPPSTSTCSSRCSARGCVSRRLRRPRRHEPRRPAAARCVRAKSSPSARSRARCGTGRDRRSSRRSKAS